MASFRTAFDTTPEELAAYLNRYLPEDIAVTDVRPAPERFHARLNARGKTYRYTIRNSAVPDVFRQRFEYLFPEPLDVERMQTGAVHFCGTHDFRPLSGARRTKKSTVRTLHAIDIRRDGDLITLDFTGTGFLYNMVRILTGTLIEVGAGRRDPEDIPALFQAESRAAAGYTAPARGLCLMTVDYGGSHLANAPEKE